MACVSPKRVVDEVLDRGEVDERDPDLDRVLGDALRGRRLLSAAGRRPERERGERAAYDA